MSIAPTPKPDTTRTPVVVGATAKISAGPNQALLKNLDSELLAISTTQMSELEARERFRKVALIATKGIGVCHCRCDSDGDWDVKPSHATGRIPRRHDFVVKLNEICTALNASGKLQVRKLPIPDTNGVFVPITGVEMHTELFLVIVSRDSELSQVVAIVEHVAASFQLWLKGNASTETNWRLNSLASIIELAASIENCDSVKSAAEEIANSLKIQLGCASVAVGAVKKGKLKLQAVSGVTKLDRNSATCSHYMETIKESKARDSQAIYPPVSDENSQMLIAHKQLASILQNEAVFSQPLRTDNGQDVGAWVFAGDKETIQSQKMARFISAASPRIASALALLRRAEKSRVARAISYLKRKSSSAVRWLVLAGTIGTLMLMFLPVTYRVRCNCTVEPVSKRFAVAPFDGMVEAAFAKPGDKVVKGQPLAELDGRTIRWELSGMEAERMQAQRQREIELSEGNVPKALLAELESKRLASEEKILNHKRENLIVKSPIEGIVLSGSLERAEAASITTGQVLFEIGPTSPIKIEIAIPSNEFSQVAVDSPVKIWIEGNEQSLAGKIERIYPRSELRDARNVFIATLQFENADDLLRPGMKGSVRIDGHERTLGWTIFHKPMEYMRSRLTWW